MIRAEDVEMGGNGGKSGVETIEKTENLKGDPKSGRDKAAQLLTSVESRIIVTPEGNARILRKIDLVILPILLAVYCFQSLDKTSLSYASVFGLIADTNLHGEEYSWLGSIVYVAQLIMQPAVAVMLVKLPVGKFISVMVLLWAIILCGMVAARDFSGLLATRFLLGAAEGAVGKYSVYPFKFMRSSNAPEQLLLLLRSFKCGTGGASKRTATPPGMPCWELSTW